MGNEFDVTFSGGRYYFVPLRLVVHLSVVVTWQVVPAPPQLGRSCQLLPLKQNISREAEINIYRGSNSLNTSDCVGKALGDIFASDFGFFSSYISADVAVLSEQ